MLAFKHTCALHAIAETQPPLEAWKLVLHSLVDHDLKGLQDPECCAGDCHQSHQLRCSAASHRLSWREQQVSCHAALPATCFMTLVFQ